MHLLYRGNNPNRFSARIIRGLPNHLRPLEKHISRAIPASARRLPDVAEEDAPGSPPRLKRKLQEAQKSVILAKCVKLVVHGAY